MRTAKGLFAVAAMMLMGFIAGIQSKEGEWLMMAADIASAVFWAMVAYLNLKKQDQP